MQTLRSGLLLPGIQTLAQTQRKCFKKSQCCPDKKIGGKSKEIMPAGVDWSGISEQRSNNLYQLRQQGEIFLPQKHSQTLLVQHCMEIKNESYTVLPLFCLYVLSLFNIKPKESLKWKSLISPLCLSPVCWPPDVSWVCLMRLWYDAALALMTCPVLYAALHLTLDRPIRSYCLSHYM